MAAWVPIVASLAGSALGTMMRQGDKSGEQYQRMIEEAKNVPLPVLKEYYPELYQEVINLNPEMETQVNLGPSATEGVSLDPKYKQAQMNALSKLMNISDNDGKDAQWEANKAKLLNDVNSNLKGNTNAIQQNLATRGVSGGMTELVARNLSAQEGANRQAQMELDLKSQAEQRALQSLISQGEMARGMSGQDFGQQMQKAEAKDAISRFNAANAQDVNMRNIASKNNAQERNANLKQEIANNNVDQRNNARQYNLSQPQRQFDNQMKRLGMASDARAGLAESQYRNTRDNNQFWGDIINSGAQAIGSYYSDKDKKKEDKK